MRAARVILLLMVASVLLPAPPAGAEDTDREGARGREPSRRRECRLLCGAAIAECATTAGGHRVRCRRQIRRRCRQQGPAVCRATSTTVTTTTTTTTTSTVCVQGSCLQPCSPDAPCPEGTSCIFPPGDCGLGASSGECVPTSAYCVAIFDPVCGCDGRTYGNACEAAIRGTSVRHDGTCTAS
jgi:hypothetical protein